MAITQICGKIGSGKTALATYFALMAMSGWRAQYSLNRLKQFARYLEQKYGERVEIPKHHLVYADYPISCTREWSAPIKSHHVSGWQIGYASDGNTGFPTVFLPPHSLTILDEAHQYYDCHESKGRLSQYVVKYYARSRHFFMDFIMTSQQPVSINKVIRGLVNRFIFPKVSPLDAKGKLVSEGSDKEIVKTVWNCLEFDTAGDAMDYSDTGNTKNAVITKYVYDGNIFDCYKSHAYFSTFLLGRIGQPFHGCNDPINYFAMPDIDAPANFYR